jgi:hypothetical protein
MRKKMRSEKSEAYACPDLPKTRKNCGLQTKTVATNDGKYQKNRQPDRKKLDLRQIEIISKTEKGFVTTL